jgi:hypothetical protein
MQASFGKGYKKLATIYKGSCLATPFRGYDSMGSYDDGSVEIDVSRYSGNSVISEPRFKSKVAESIWRLKNKK